MVCQLLLLCFNPPVNYSRRNARMRPLVLPKSCISGITPSLIAAALWVSGLCHHSGTACLGVWPLSWQWHCHCDGSGSVAWPSASGTRPCDTGL